MISTDRGGGRLLVVGVLSGLLLFTFFLAACGGGGGGGGSIATAEDFNVGSAGGTLDYISPDNPDIMASLNIPAGAVSDGTVITVDLSSAVSDSNVIPGLGFEFSPDGLAFAQSVEFVVTYDETALPPGTDESELKIHKWSGSDWLELPSTVDELNNTVTAFLSGFSLYFVFPEIPTIPGLMNWTIPSGVGDAVFGSFSNTGSGEIQLYASMADNGEAVVSWLVGVGPGDYVYMTEYREGTWAHASAPIDPDDYINLDPPPGVGNGIYDLALDMNDSGETIIAFNQYDGGDTAAWRVYQSYFNGSTWNHPSYLATDAMSAVGPYASRPDAYYPAAAIDGSGDAILVWHMKDAANEDRFYRREYRDGVWSPEPIPATDALNPAGTAGDMDPPHVAANENGDAVLLWKESAGMRILEYRDAGGGHAWSTTVDLFDVLPDDSRDVKVVVAANGDAVILVKDYDLWMMEKRSGGSWTEPRIINEEDDRIPNEAYSIAMDDNGNTIIVWQQPDSSSGDDHIYMREYSAAAATWSPVPSLTMDAISPPTMSSTYPEDFRNPQVAMADNGDAVIVFAGAYAGSGVCDGAAPSFVGYCQQIFMTQRTGGGQWTHETGPAQIISPTTSTSDYNVNREPVAAMDGGGNAIVVWDQFDSEATRYLFMSEYR